MEIIKLTGEELNGLPLFFHTIYFNKLVDDDDEQKLCVKSNSLQTDIFCPQQPSRSISQTVNKKLFIKINEN